MIHFIRPTFLLLLILPPIVAYILWRNNLLDSSWKRYISPHLAKFLLKGNQVASTNIKFLSLLLISWIIAVIAISGPSFFKKELPIFNDTNATVLVLDMSMASLATDLAPDRLTQIKFRVQDILKHLSGEIGVIAYTSEPFTMSPLTTDKKNILNFLPSLSPSIMPVAGSDVHLAIESAIKLLQNGNRAHGNIIVISNGVNSEDVPKASGLLGGTKYRLAIMPIGTSDGGPITLADGGYYKENGNILITRVDFNVVAKFASDAGGVMIPITNDGQDIEFLGKWLNSAVIDNDNKVLDKNKEQWLDFGPYLALLLLIPALLNFNRGFLAIILLILNMHTSKPAFADDDLWLTQDQQAALAYDAGDYEKAAQLFKDPNWKATAFYKKGDYKKASEIYAKDLSAKGYYNLGNSQIKEGKYKDAKDSYEKSLTLNPKDPALVRENLEIAKKLLEQKKEQEKKDQKGQDQKGQDQKGQDQKGQDQKGQDQKGQDQKGQDQKGQDQKGQDQKGQDQKGQDQKGQDQKGQDQKGQDQKGQDQKGQDQKGQDQKGQDQKGQDQKGQDQKSQDQKGQKGQDLEEEDQKNKSEKVWKENTSTFDSKTQDKEVERVDRVLKQLNSEPADFWKMKMEKEYIKRRGNK